MNIYILVTDIARKINNKTFLRKTYCYTYMRHSLQKDLKGSMPQNEDFPESFF